MQHDGGKFTFLGSMLGMPMKLRNRIAANKTNQTYIHRGTYWYPNWLCVCPAWGTEPNSTQQLRHVGTQ